MNIILFITYLSIILLLIAVITTILLKWKDFIPRLWRLLFVLSFLGVILGLLILLIAEIIAPYNSNYYINPFLYMIYFGLIGSSMFIIYLLIVQIHFKHIKFLMIVGIIVFGIVILFLIISIIIIMLYQVPQYPWTAYLVFELVYGHGIIAYILLAIGSFSHITSDRLEKKVRIGLFLTGIFSLGMIWGLLLIAIGLLYVDFSTALTLYTSIFWLIWIGFVAIIFLLMVRGAINMIS